MISAKIKITQIYKNDGSDDCIKAQVLTSTEKLVVHEKYKTVSIYGKFPEFFEQYKKYIVTLSDYPSNKGNYKLIIPGRLPRKETLEDLLLLVMETIDDRWSVDDYEFLIETIEELTSAERSIVLKYLDKDKNYSFTKKELDFIKEYNDLVFELKKIYKKAKKIVDFRSELINSLNINDENVHYTIIKNIKGDLKKAVNALKVNPYLLIDMAEMPLATVDEIALSIGVKANDDNRVAAITEMNLRRYGAEGKTWLDKNLYLSECDEIYSYSTPDYEFSKDYLLDRINNLGNRAGFYVEVDKDRIASSKYYLLEQELFSIIKNLSTGNCTKIPKKTIDKAIFQCEKKNGINLLTEQKNAVYNSFKNDLSVIAGAAGTGKTTIAKAVTNVYKDVVVTALSGKATLRISETTNICGENSRTMHSFSMIDKKYIEAELIIIDESSMVGLDIAIDFFKKVKPETHVLILGDHCQLSPIGAGNMFYDLLHSDFINVSIIEEVHRQALDSSIISFATDVRKQEYNISGFIENREDFEMYLLKDNKEIANKSIEVFKNAIAEYKIEDIMLVSPTKKVTYVLNNEIQRILSNEGHIGESVIELETPWDSNLKFNLRKGDRVINLENFHKCPSSVEGSTVAVMNGSLGTFNGKKAIKNKKGKTIKEVYEFDFDGIGVGWYSKSDLKRIVLGYCITVHKSQGSQAPLLVYIHPLGCHDRLNCSEMVYTAVTRAKNKAIVISADSVLEKAIITKELNSKQTLLKEFLDENSNKKSSQETINNEVAVDENLKSFAEKYKPKKQKKKEVISGNSEPEIEILEGQVTVEEALEKVKKRAKYDKNNAQKRAKRRNENGLLDREQSKLDNINLVKNLKAQGKTNTEIVQITGLTKGTVSKYLRL